MKITYLTVKREKFTPIIAIIAQTDTHWHWIFERHDNNKFRKLNNATRVPGRYEDPPEPPYIVEKMTEDELQQFISEHFDELL